MSSLRSENFFPNVININGGQPVTEDVLHSGMWLKQTVCGMVDDLPSVRVYVSETEIGTVFTVVVSPDDIGKVIGKKGNHARALRSLLTAVGMKHRRRFDLNLQEGMR
jgi:predicted RNA-binding protein YlqC (UPF0109 family)